MDGIGVIKTISLQVPFADITFEVNPVTILTTWGICLFLIVMGEIVVARLKQVPSRLQSIVELIYEAFDGMVRETIEDNGKGFVPYILTIFLFVLFANWISLVPGLESPTADLNTCLALGIIAFLTAHGTAISRKGIKGYIKNYLEPIPLLLPSNIVSEIGKLVSHSFRLFGNMYAGGIVIALIPVIVLKLAGIIGVPFLIMLMPLLKGFFDVFLGAIQAFVFALLAAAYISVLL